MALVIIFLVHNLHHYIPISQTRVVVDSNPIHYLLSCHLVQSHVVKWIVVLQEYDLEFVTPKRTKALGLYSLMADLPSSSSSPPIMASLPDEFLFVISTEDPWYGGILHYLHTQKFGPHLTSKYHHHIRHQVA